RRPFLPADRMAGRAPHADPRPRRPVGHRAGARRRAGGRGDRARRRSRSTHPCAHALADARRGRCHDFHRRPLRAPLPQPLDDLAGDWGFELVLEGAMEDEEFVLAGVPARPTLARTRALMLGAADATLFADGRYAHRCRNLSATRPALSLHVYGGTLDRYRS